MRCIQKEDGELTKMDTLNFEPIPGVAELRGGKIYRLVFPNGKCYIGQTIQPYYERSCGPSFAGYKGCNALLGAISKYGPENVVLEILFYDPNASLEMLNELEKQYIDHFHSLTHENGYNITVGGDGTGGHTVSDELRKKLSKLRKDELAQGINRLAHEITPETRRKLSDSAKRHQAEHPIPKEQRIRQGNSWRENGNKTWNAGIKFTDEYKQRYKKKWESQGKPVKCLETSVVYHSSAEAERETGVCACNINRCCNHDKKRSTAGGFHWEFADM